jgi:predicted MFS family arabinose efflux permease
MAQPLDSMSRRTAATSGILFLCLFAAQAGLIALSPVLADVADDLDYSTAVAGQLRTVAGVAAGITALALGPVARRLGLGRQLLAGTALVAVGAASSAAAPTFLLLAVAQVPVGAGAAILTTAGTVAAAAWAPPDQRTRVLSWALVGHPAAWIVGMPLVGVVGGHGWRYAWLVLPLVAATLAGATLVRRAGEPPAESRSVPMRRAVTDARLRRWLAAETLANTAWAGTLVYSGALFVESYGVSTRLTGVLLAVAAAAYVAGNLAFRRLAEATRLLPTLLLALAATTALFGAVRTSVLASVAIFSAAAFAAGARTLISSAAALASPTELRPAAMAARSASMQLGYFVGSLGAGAALAAGGYAAFGLTVAVGFVAAAAALAPLPRFARSSPCAADAAL